jgi:hypothetical protein
LIVDAFFKLIAAGPLFFVSAWLLMLFAGIVGADVGIRPFGYVTAMVVTIALWLALAPAIGAVGRAPGKGKLSTALPRRAARSRRPRPCAVGAPGYSGTGSQVTS